jgi:hypothetical protein
MRLQRRAGFRPQRGLVEIEIEHGLQTARIIGIRAADRTIANRAGRHAAACAIGARAHACSCRIAVGRSAGARREKNRHGAGEKQIDEGFHIHG